MQKHRLCEIIPVQHLNFDGPYQVTFIDWAKNLETRRVETREEVLKLQDIWLSGGTLPVHLAQFNITRLKYPLDAPQMKDFVDGIEFIHSIADRMGIIYRVKGESGNATEIKVLDDPLIIPNLTVWPDVDTLKKFVYNTIHKKYIQRKTEWFLPETEIQNVFWWIPVGHKPEMSEGEERYKHMIANGSSDYAFDWKFLEKK